MRFSSVQYLVSLRTLTELRAASRNNQLVFVYTWSIPFTELSNTDEKGRLFSPEFATTLNGIRYSWKLMLCPNGGNGREVKANGKTSLFLVYSDGPKKTVSIEFRLFVPNRNIGRESGVRTFGPNVSRCGFPDFCDKNLHALGDSGVLAVAVKITFLRENGDFELDQLLPEVVQVPLPSPLPEYEYNELAAQKKHQLSNFALVTESNESFPCNKVVLAHVILYSRICSRMEMPIQIKKLQRES